MSAKTFSEYWDNLPEIPINPKDNAMLAFNSALTSRQQEVKELPDSEGYWWDAYLEEIGYVWNHPILGFRYKSHNDDSPYFPANGKWIKIPTPEPPTENNKK